ncbi:MAG: DUF4062 domain-containing protein [Kiritimatiellia bacterium]
MAVKLNLMVASTVHHYEDQIRQVCAVLSGFGYDVWNSHIGTIPQHPGFSNLKNCKEAARNCHIFVGFIRPFYGSGIVGARSITHEEFRVARQKGKPRWFMAHRDVTFSRQLLKPYMFKRDGKPTNFKLKKNPVLDDLRVIDLYNDAIQNHIPVARRRGHWVQEFYRIEEVLEYLDNQFKDVRRIRKICKDMGQI